MFSSLVKKQLEYLIQVIEEILKNTANLSSEEIECYSHFKKYITFSLNINASLKQNNSKLLKDTSSFLNTQLYKIQNDQIRSAGEAALESLIEEGGPSEQTHNLGLYYATFARKFPHKETHYEAKSKQYHNKAFQYFQSTAKRYVSSAYYTALYYDEGFGAVKIDFKKAMQIYRQIINNTPTIPDDKNKAALIAEYHRHRIDSLTSLAEIHQKEHRPMDAMKEFERILSEESDYLTKEKMLDVKLVLGNMYTEATVTSLSLYQKAKQLFLDCINEKFYGPDHIALSRYADVLTIEAQVLYHNNKLKESNDCYKEAFETYQLVLSHHPDHPHANFQIAYFYENGLGLSSDPEKSYEYFEKSSELGGKIANIYLGKAHEKIQDYEAAKQYYEKANVLPEGPSKQYNEKSKALPEALFCLGRLYEKGLGVTADLEKAMDLYQLSAGNRHAPAILRLAQLSEKTKTLQGKKITKSLYKAAFDEFTNKASIAQENTETAEANFWLGWLHQHGKHSKIDLEAALFYYQKAAKLHYPAAKDHIQLIKQLKNKSAQSSPPQSTLSDGTNTKAVNTPDLNSLNAARNAATEIKPIEPDHFQEFYTLFHANKFAKALQLIAKIQHDLKINIDVIKEAHSLWMIANCHVAELGRLRNRNKIAEKTKAVQIAYQKACEFVNEQIKNLPENSKESIELQSIKAFIETESQQFNTSDTANQKALDSHEHEITIPTTKMVPKKQPNKIDPAPSPTETKSEIKLTYLSNKMTHARHFPITLPLSKNALWVLNTLKTAGAARYIHGGFVRDSYLNITKNKNQEIHDVDIITNFHPDEIAQLFPNCSEVIGKRFPIVLIYCDDGEVIEVTTFRAPPKDVNGLGINEEYGTLQTDHLLRDFTVNSLYYNVDNNTIEDFVNGIDDLDNEMMRFEKNPVLSLSEDPLRALRCIRFAASLKFNIEENAQLALESHGHLLAQVHPSRIYAETKKLFHPNYASTSFSLLKKHHLLQHIFPSISNYLNWYQDKNYATMLELLFSSERNVPDLDVIIACILSGPLKAYLLKMPNLESAINRTLLDLSYRIYLPKDVLQSVKNILYYQLKLPENTFLSPENPYAGKINFIQELQQLANNELAKQESLENEENADYSFTSMLTTLGISNDFSKRDLSETGHALIDGKTLQPT